MAEKVIVGPINKGLRTDRTPFVIDNDSFPTLINAYQWRGRVKRKRGTQFLGRLQRYFLGAVLLDGSGNANLVSALSLESDATIVPLTVTITGPGPTVYTDNGDGILYLLGVASGTINYSSGAISIPARAGNGVAASFVYNPNLPVLGLEEFRTATSAFPDSLAFDTTYSYAINTTFPYPIHSVSFYKNVATATYPLYVQKANWTPITWNGQDYQQFWTVNYQGAIWVTNGINVPFSTTNIGMPFKPIVTVTVLTPITAQLTINSHGLVVGDFLFINEVSTTQGINFQTGYVITRVDANDVVVEFPNANIAVNGGGGIAQYLTNRPDTTKDCIRWYDGDPTDGAVISPTFLTGHGWVNFCPPLSQGIFSISDLPADQYYLVGARMIVPFKDRLLFIGPVVQSSSTNPVYLQDTVIFSQNGTPYYTCSFTYDAGAPTDPTLASIVFNPILVPTNQTAIAPAYFEDQTGFGGFIQAGLDLPIITTSSNEDVLIMGFDPNIQARFVYTGNDLLPFSFFLINSELGSNSTFSFINLDKGVITKGDNGFVITSQTEAVRIDMPIPDQVFEISLTNNGNERVCAQRDFINEWIYFTYPSSSLSYSFPNQTLLYNYRDDTWAIFNESYTTYGQFKKRTGFSWQDVFKLYPSWNSWNDAWDAGESQVEQPEVIAGNQQGFVLIKSEGTDEGTSLYIQGFSGNQITSPNHNLQDGDYILITGCLGGVKGDVNGKIFQIANTANDTFDIIADLSSSDYSGAGLITRVYVPYFQTKQFPVSWGMGRKTRLGPQMYLLTTTSNAEITLLIFLSQNSSSSYNILPNATLQQFIDSGLIYGTVLYTCPESTNLGLTPSNVNLQMPTAFQQEQIWHRLNTPLIGDTIQLGFTLSNDQILDLKVSGESASITGATQANPCVLTCDGEFDSNQLIQISGVEGMTQLNGNTYLVISSSSTEVTLDLDATGFDVYTSGGTATPVAYVNGTAEIELHGFILDVSPSQLLA